MFFSYPFILASEFIQHVGVIVLLGALVVEWVVTRRSEQATAVSQKNRKYTSIAYAVLFMTLLIVGEYFIPVKSVHYTYLVLIPILTTASMFLYTEVRGYSERWTVWYFRVYIAVVIMHILFSVATAYVRFPEKYLIYSLFKMIEVVILYMLVIQYICSRKFMQNNSVQIQGQDVTYRSTIPASVLLRKSVSLFIVMLTLGVSLALPCYAYAFSLTTRIGDQSTEVKAGDRLYFDVEIKWPENPRRQDLRVEYQILDNGEVIASEKVLRAVETQASFLDYLVVPTNTKSGMKEFNVIIQTYDGSLKEELKATFYVMETSNQTLLYFLILAGAIVLVVALVVFQIIMLSRTQSLLARKAAAG